MFASQRCRFFRVQFILKSQNWDEAFIDVVFICDWGFGKLLEDKLYLKRTKAISSTELGHDLEEILKGYFLVFARDGSAHCIQQFCEVACFLHEDVLHFLCIFEVLSFVNQIYFLLLLV